VFVAVADNKVGVGDMVVSASVGGRSVDAETVSVGISGIAVGGEVGVGAGVQAATKTTAMMKTMI
jgi:hypothetical protein